MNYSQIIQVQLFMDIYIIQKRRGKKFLKDYFNVIEEKRKSIPEGMKEYLSSILDNKIIYEKIKDSFIQVLADAKFTSLDVINSLKIKISTKKWKKFVNKTPLKKRCRNPLDGEKLTRQIKK